MRAVSSKRAKQLRVYTQLRRDFMDANPACELCGHASQELHHKAGRSGRRLTEVSNFAALCSPCHKHITESPAEAYRLGISERRVSTP